MRIVLVQIHETDSQSRDVLVAEFAGRDAEEQADALLTRLLSRRSRKTYHVRGILENGAEAGTNIFPPEGGSPVSVRATLIEAATMDCQYGDLFDVKNGTAFLEGLSEPETG